MSWIKDLKSLLKINFNFSQPIVKINSENDHRQVNLHIDLSNKKDLTLDDLQSLTKAIKVGLKENKNFLVSSTQSQEKNNLIKQNLKLDNKSDGVIKFIQDVIPVQDQAIWFSALILRVEFKKGHKEQVRQIKLDLINSHQDRGRNIANLCSAGYLESHIIPLYRSLAIQQNSLNNFLEIYELVVTEYPFAIFVSQITTKPKLKKELFQKIEKVTKYGWHKVYIHGLGEDNVKKISQVVSKLEASMKKIKNVEWTASQNHIVVMIHL